MPRKEKEPVQELLRPFIAQPYPDSDPVRKSFGAYSNLCINKKRVVPALCLEFLECIHEFFHKVKAKYPELFQYILFENSEFSPQVDRTLEILVAEKHLISYWENSIKRVYVVSKRMLLVHYSLDNRIRPYFNDIALMLYEQYSCNTQGERGKSSSFRRLEELS